MSKQSWRGSTLLNPEPPVLVSCGGLDHPNLITIGWTGTTSFRRAGSLPSTCPPKHWCGRWIGAA